MDQYNKSFFSKNLSKPLIEACQNYDITLIKDLLNQGADVNLQNDTGATPLHIACQLGSIDIVQLLIDHHANVNLLTIDGWTPLHFTAQRGDLEIAKLLIRSGVDVNVAGLRYGRTALHYATDQGREEVVSILLQNGAKVDLKDRFNHTALDIAKKKDYLLIIELLGGKVIESKTPSKTLLTF